MASLNSQKGPKPFCFEVSLRGLALRFKGALLEILKTT